MNARERFSFHEQQSLGKADENAFNIDVLFAIAKRQWRLVTIGVLIGGILGIGYLFSAIPLYTSTVRILYDKTQANAFDDLTTVSDIYSDKSEFDSQLVLVRSERIAEQVVERLKLHTNDRFLYGQKSQISSALSSVKSLFSAGSLTQEAPIVDEAVIERRKQRAVGILRGNVSASRLARTYIFNLRYTSSSPQLSQRISSEFAKVYLDDQLESKYEATRRASEWLQSRIVELKDQSLQADLAVQQFKAENNLVNPSNSTDQSLVQAQLSGANSQVIVARGDIVTLRARYDKLNQAVETQDISVAVDETQTSTVMSAFRQNFLELSREYNDFSSRLSSNHNKLVKLRKDLDENQRLMFEELRRIRDNAKSELDIAIAREQRLNQNLTNIVGQTASVNKDQVRLRELEREAETYRLLLNNFLQKYRESVQQQSFAVNDARIISDSRPGYKSHPNSMYSLAFAMFLGGLIGGAFGGVRELRESYFRTGDQVRDILDVEFFGLSPKLNDKNGSSLPESKKYQNEPGYVSHHSEITNFVTRNPLSSFAETLRGAKIAADIKLNGEHGKIIGVSSVLPGEGKSTTASNLAQLLSDQGNKVLLIDCDIRNPGLTRAIARHAKKGLVELLMDDAKLNEVVLRDKDNKRLCVLPSAINKKISHTADLLASSRMDSLLNSVRKQFDYVVVDLPPIAPVVDVKAFVSRIDGILMVVEWGKTKRSLVKNVLEANPTIKQKILGVSLNKTEMDKLKLYRAYGSSDYYYSSYSSYYRDENIKA